MPFLRSFGFWRFEIERDVAPRGLGKASLRDKEDDWGGFPGALLLISSVLSGRFWGSWLDRVVEREGVIKFLTVRSLEAGPVPKRYG